MRRICSENALLGDFVIAQTSQSVLTQTQMVEPTAHLGHVGEPVAPRLHSCAAGYCTKGHEIKSSKRESDAVKRHSPHKMYEVTARVTQLTVSQKIFY